MKIPNPRLLHYLSMACVLILAIVLLRARNLNQDCRLLELGAQQLESSSFLISEINDDLLHQIQLDFIGYPNARIEKSLQSCLSIRSAKDSLLAELDTALSRSGGLVPEQLMSSVDRFYERLNRFLITGNDRSGKITPKDSLSYKLFMASNATVSDEKNALKADLRLNIILAENEALRLGAEAGGCSSNCAWKLPIIVVPEQNFFLPGDSLKTNFYISESQNTSPWLQLFLNGKDLERSRGEAYVPLKFDKPGSYPVRVATRYENYRLDTVFYKENTVFIRVRG